MPRNHTSPAALLVSAALSSLVPGSAFAQSSDEAGAGDREVEPQKRPARRSARLPVGFEVSAGTRFPLDIGIDGVVEAPFGLTGHLGLGWMPRFYRDAINDTLVAVGAYEDADAAVVAAALEDAFMISPSIGWRFHGFEIYGGYVLAFLGGTITRAEAEDISGEDLRAGGVSQVPLSGKAHAFQLGVAYQATLRPHLALRMSLAYFQIFDSQTSIDVATSGAAAMQVVARVENALDDYLRDLMSSYVKSPLFGFAVVWQF